jgi:acetyl-CoA carboxylase biotin carboxylase subunit
LFNLLVASGKPLNITQSKVAFRGHAIECRVTAELPYENFRPSPGRITTWRSPGGEFVRLDTHCFEGYTVPLHYDSLLAKLIVHAENRSKAIECMLDALARFSIEGIGTTLPFLKFAVSHPEFVGERMNTHLVDRMIKEMTSNRA